MRSRVRYAAITLLIASVPLVLMVLTSRANREPRAAAEPIGELLIYGAAEWYPWAFVAPLIDRLVRRTRFARRSDIWRAIGRHAALWAGFAVIHGSVVYAVTKLLYSAESFSLWRAIAGGSLPTALLYSAIAIGFTVAESRRRHTEITERLRAEVAEAKLDALRQQLNPHFLFNTLNHIVSQLRSGEVTPALRMLLALSDLLRDVLRERAQLIPLRDEVRMVERYLEIERERFGDRLRAEVTFEPRALDALVPSLLLQPLLENAMRHGVSVADGTCRLWLAARAVDDRVIITVRDAGPGLDPSKARGDTGVGLSNTQARLAYLYGADHRFTLQTLEGGGLQIAIDLPFRRS